MKRIAFVGKRSLGGVQMRGRDVAQRLGVPFYDLREPLGDARWDVLIVVKYWDDQIPRLRTACDVLLLDPLDCWTQTKPDAEPVDFWKWVKRQTGCDGMIATSPAAETAMNRAGVTTIHSPHHADPRIDGDWYNPRGPVVYLGGERFLSSQGPSIAQACNRLGRRFVTRYDRDCWQSLRGAALSLCVRFGAERTSINTVCKPAVKVANAAAAGVPVLCTEDPAIMSLCDVPTHDEDWEESIAEALTWGPPRYPHAIENHVELLRGIFDA